jgi:nitroimidazol reductase NimA-like FMN-containing flavoprotein (pyridoxamine 5'-phosphate oxidase superfamily)
MREEYDIFVDELDDATCWRLVERAGFGRVGFMQDDQLLVLPVNAGVMNRRIVFRTASDTSLANAGTGSVVAFEADHTDRVAESGWSVLVRGRLWDVTDDPEVATRSELAVHAWAPPPRDRWMAIDPTRITGRMIRRHRNLPAGVQVPYMPPD